MRGEGGVNSVDRLLNLEFHRLEVWRFDNGNIGVEYRDGWVKDGPVLKGECGEGKTFEAACDNYMRKISGKTLAFGSDERIKVL